MKGRIQPFRAWLPGKPGVKSPRFSFAGQTLSGQNQQKCAASPSNCPPPCAILLEMTDLGSIHGNSDLRPLSDEWRSRLAGIDAAHFRLIWVAGRSPADRTGYLKSVSQAIGAPYLAIGKLLSAALLELPPSLRASSAEDSFTDILRNAGSPIVVIDHLDVLFDRGLMLNPVGLIQNVSRRFTIIASWPGAGNPDGLTYAPEDHPSHVHIPLRALESPVYFL